MTKRYTKMATLTYIFIIAFTINLFTIHNEPSHKDFEIYIKEFERHCNMKTNSTVMYGKDFQKNVIGLCYPAVKKIYINKRYTSIVNNYEIEQLIWHELVHCELNRGHTERYIERDGDLIPESIMYPSVFSIHVYLKHRDYYIKEMCERK